jgi:ABC-2 type transport system ATP-binding protein
VAKSIVEVKDLVKKYGDLSDVKGINFEIEEGEIFGLLGPNGAGKTTIISMLSCLLEPTAGTAIIDGRDVVKDADKVKQVIGIVP